jgi:hypothetical protein
MKINGSLVFDASSASEITNLRVEKLGSLPTHAGAADAGRLVYISTNTTLYKGTASAWEALATGGNAFSQVEGDAIETALGAGITSEGVFNAAGFTNTDALTSPTSFTNAIQQIANYAQANDSLFELNDVTLSSGGAALSPAGPKFLFHGTGAGQWVDHTLVLADVSDVTTTVAELNELHTGGAVLADFVKLHAVTSSAVELNKLTGATLSTTELNYVTGVTSAIQTQLNGKQGLDAGLTALAVFNTNGIIVQTADNAYAGRTTVAPAAGVTITNPDGVAGDITFALADDLAGLEGLAGTGFAVRTGTSAWTNRALVSGSSARVVITNGDGVAAAPTIDLATVTNSASGTFLKLATDGYGRVTGTTAVLLTDIEAIAETTYVHAAGDTMDSGAVLTFTGVGSKLILPNLPTADTDAANKAYVDSIAAGLSWKTAVRVASTGNLDLTGGSLTAIDGVNLANGDRILVKNQTLPAQNGIYVYSSTGNLATRATDMDLAAEFAGATVFVTEGTANADSGWTQTAEVVAVGTTAVAFAQFSGSSTYNWGVGLVASGNTVNINVGAGITELPSDEVGIDLFDSATGALILTSNGTNRLTSSPSQLYLMLDSGATGGLGQSAAGLFIKPAGVTNTQLVNSTLTLDGDGVGTGSVALGSTLSVFGDTTSGVITALSGSTFTVSAEIASTTQRGTAKFATADFAVDVAGEVTIKAAGVDNAQLVNSTITVTGTTGSDAVALGESFSIVGGSAPITTVSAANSVTISVADADVSTKGLASFNSAHFSVSSGAVSLLATLDDLDNVSSADLAATGTLLTKSAGDWVPVSRVDVAGSVNLGDLQDVGSAAPTATYALIGDGSAWQAKKIFHVDTISAAATSWVVTHNLGTKYCNVTIVDATDNVVIPQSIVFDSTTQLTVTFNTAITGKAVVMGVA